MSEYTDRWKSDGDCSKCRREPYCKKPCKAYGEAVKRDLRRMLANRIAELYRKQTAKSTPPMIGKGGNNNGYFNDTL